VQVIIRGFGSTSIEYNEDGTVAGSRLHDQGITYTVMYMKHDSMIRTQVYLSKEQEQALKALALTSGTRQSELIREAVDLLLSEKNAMHPQWKDALRGMKGRWADDKDTERRMQTIRDEFDR
jgi:predicted DNA-binding protein